MLTADGDLVALGAPMERGAATGAASVTAASVRVLGVDPGLTRTGWALLTPEGRRYRLLGAGVLAPRASGELAGRLADAYRRFAELLAAGRPDVFVIEDVFTTPRYPKAALRLAHLRGVLCLAAAQAELPVISLTATTVKQRLTGNGHASKEQVQRMVFELCDLAAAKTPSDLSDAVALAIAGLHQMKFRPDARGARPTSPARDSGPRSGHGRSQILGTRDRAR